MNYEQITNKMNVLIVVNLLVYFTGPGVIPLLQHLHMPDNLDVV